MPGEMDGLDLAHAVQQRFPAVPVVLISGYGEDPSSGFPFIAKPFLPETILKVVERVLPARTLGLPSPRTGTSSADLPPQVR